VYDPEDEPDGEDVLWMDRLHKRRPNTGHCAEISRNFDGAKIFHQFIYYPKWDHGIRDDWTVLTRERSSMDERIPFPMSSTACSAVPRSNFRWWEPFLQALDDRSIRYLDHEFDVGYIGRLPKFDGRTTHVEQALIWLRSNGFSIGLGGPGDAASIAASLDIEFLGKVDQQSVVREMSRSKIILQFAADPYRDKDAVPNRVVEAHLAARVQVFSSKMGMIRRFPGLGRYSFSSSRECAELVRHLLNDPRKYDEALAVQNQAFSGLLDPQRTMSNLFRILEGVINAAKTH
jgi:hypothetical protein